MKTWKHCQVTVIVTIIALAFIFTACDDGSGGDGGGGDSGLNGTWVNQAGEVWVFNNGRLTVKVDNVESIRGTYFTSGNNITVTFTEIMGSVLGTRASEIGLSTNQWYTKSQFRTAVINYAVSQGLSQSQAATLVDELLEENPIYDPITGSYTLNGDTLTIDSATLTRQGGGGDNPGGTGNLQNWIAVTDSTFRSLGIYAISYGNVGNAGNRFVAGFSMDTAYSANGISWTAGSANVFNHSFDVIAYGNGRFLAGNTSNEMAYSTNGITWPKIQSPFSSTSAGIEDIAWGNNRFVVVGGSTSGNTAYSADGTSWTVTNSLLGVGRAIAYGNNRFVAAGTGGTFRLSYSTDGATWTGVTDGTVDYAIGEIAYGNNTWVVGGSDGKMAYSRDNGVTWTAVADSTSDARITAIAYGNNRFVAAFVGGKLAYSEDGASWTAVSNSTFPSTTNSGSNYIIYDIAYGSGRFVAVGSNGRMAYCDW